MQKSHPPMPAAENWHAGEDASEGLLEWQSINEFNSAFVFFSPIQAV